MPDNYSDTENAEPSSHDRLGWVRSFFGGDGINGTIRMIGLILICVVIGGTIFYFAQH